MGPVARSCGWTMPRRRWRQGMVAAVACSAWFGMRLAAFVSAGPASKMQPVHSIGKPAAALSGETGVRHDLAGDLKYAAKDGGEAVLRRFEADQAHRAEASVGVAQDMQRLPVRIDGVWYDLASWRAKHPAGAHWIDNYAGRDATEVMNAFHSKKAQAMFRRLPLLPDDEVPMGVPDVSQETLAFRGLRKRLEDEGWWERDASKELREIAIWAGLVASGVTLAQLQGDAAALSVFPLGLSFVSACWIAHDYVHAADEWGKNLRLFGPLASGLSSSWWAQRHNTHHAHTNEIGTDADIATAPQLFLWAPDPADDNPTFRNVQHYLLPFWFSLIFVLWRISGALTAIEGVQRGRPGAVWEAAALCVHWAFFLLLVPGQYLFAAILLSGVIGASIVTATHQTEEMFTSPQQDWVSAQFRSTCDAATRGPFTEWLWGGMQYQVEHHLFPTMPRSRYPALRPVLAEFASKHPNIEGGYRVLDEVELLQRNFQLYSDVAQAPPAAGAPSSKVRPASMDVAPIQERVKNLFKSFFPGQSAAVVEP